MYVLCEATAWISISVAAQSSGDIAILSSFGDRFFKSDAEKWLPPSGEWPKPMIFLA